MVGIRSGAMRSPSPSVDVLSKLLVGGWATPLKNMKVSWEDYSQYMGK